MDTHRNCQLQLRSLVCLASSHWDEWAESLDACGVKCYTAVAAHGPEASSVWRWEIDMEIERASSASVTHSPRPEIVCLPVGMLQANCYLVACPETRQTIIVDPGAEPEHILRAVSEAGMTVIAIVHTHGHFDHISATEAVLEGLHQPLPIVAHPEDAFLYTAESRGMGRAYGYDMPARCLPPDMTMMAGDILHVGTLRLSVRHTPGHTPGSVSLVCGEVCAFSGDTLFRRGIGRTDLAGGDEDAIYESILTQLYSLPADMQVYPGHGPGTTIGEEARENPFVQTKS